MGQFPGGCAGPVDDHVVLGTPQERGVRRRRERDGAGPDRRGNRQARELRIRVDVDAGGRGPQLRPQVRRRAHRRVELDVDALQRVAPAGSGRELLGPGIGLRAQRDVPCRGLPDVAHQHAGGLRLGQPQRDLLVVGPLRVESGPWVPVPVAFGKSTNGQLRSADMQHQPGKSRPCWQAV